MCQCLRHDDELPEYVLFNPLQASAQASTLTDQSSQTQQAGVVTSPSLAHAVHQRKITGSTAVITGGSQVALVPFDIPHVSQKMPHCPIISPAYMIIA